MHQHLVFTYRGTGLDHLASLCSLGLILAFAALETIDRIDILHLKVWEPPHFVSAYLKPTNNLK
jgi:hypothetical protein